MAAVFWASHRLCDHSEQACTRPAGHTREASTTPPNTTRGGREKIAELFTRDPPPSSLEARTSHLAGSTCRPRAGRHWDNGPHMSSKIGIGPGELRHS